MEVSVSHETITRLIFEAVDRGQVRLPLAEGQHVDLSGGCADPYVATLVAQRLQRRWIKRREVARLEMAGHGRHFFVREDQGHLVDMSLFDSQITIPVFLDVHVPCRQCTVCLDARKRRWQARACCEFDNSARTWFLTFTLRPSARFYAELDGGMKRFCCVSGLSC